MKAASAGNAGVFSVTGITTNHGIETMDVSKEVDEFLSKRMRPDCPAKIAARAQSKAVLRQYYERKRSEQQRIGRKGFGEAGEFPKV